MAVINIFLEHIYEALDQLQSDEAARINDCCSQQSEEPELKNGSGLQFDNSELKNAGCILTDEICNKDSYEYKLLKLLKYASNLGISGLECDFFRLWDEDLKYLFDEAGLSVASIYRTFDFGHALREESLRQIDEVLKCAKLYGADKILAIPGFINEDDDGEEVISKMTELLKLFVERADNLGIRVTLEDFDLNTAPYSTISGLKCFFENVPGLGYTFDTGNFAYSLEDELEAYNALRPYICHVHLKDRSWDGSRADKKASNAKANLSGRLMYPSEVGGGFIKIRECLELLKKDGYEGSFSIEHFGAVNQLEYMKKSVFNLKDML